MSMLHTSNSGTGFKLMLAFMVVFNLVFWSGVGYVAWHFISKFW